MTELSDAVLIARGKYATLGAAFRKADKVRQEQMHVIENARIKSMQAFSIKSREDFDFALGQLAVMQNAQENAYNAIAEMQKLRQEMDKLKPEAWGKETDE